jgi:hypothetical protein
MTRIVTSTYRYRRPPRKRQAVAIEVPAVVKAAEHVTEHPTHPAAIISPDTAPDATLSATKSAIVTARRPGKRYVEMPDMTPEELQRRGDAADALFREVVRRIKRRP